LRSTRSPSGDQVYSPAASLRSMPALSISLWLAISASAGVSFSVCRWNCDRRMWAVVGEGLAILPCGRSGNAGCGAAAAAGFPPEGAGGGPAFRPAAVSARARGAIAVDFDRGVGLDRDAFVLASLGRGVRHVQGTAVIA